MNSHRLEGKWTQMKGAVKERWGQLTDDDADIVNRRSDQPIGKLQDKDTSIAQAEAQRHVDE